VNRSLPVIALSFDRRAASSRRAFADASGVSA
jgi:hypothetical protein